MSPDPVTTEQLLDLLQPWLPSRRWFHEHQDPSRLTVVWSFELVDPAGEARLPVLLVGTGERPAPPYVHVPLSLRPHGTPAPAAAHVGSVAGWDVFDGPGDPAFVRAWLAAAEGDHRPEELDADAARLVAGEQSNSSIIVPARDPARPGAILKVFRDLWPGPNPDVDVPLALARAGFEHVPPPLATLERRWDAEPLPGATTSEAADAGGPPNALDAPSVGTDAPAPTQQTVQLGVLATFVPGARDGFELACELAERGESFAPLAAELGTVLAELHEALARALPVEDPTRDPAALIKHLRDRFTWAARQVPELERWRTGVSEAVDRLAALPALPALQRIHGDLHLGQLLRTDSEWFVLDFEGEPLVPLPERALPDLALRDVAGILRSLDYAAARGNAPTTWTETARSAFLAAYRASCPEAATPHAADLLRAFEIDKALYEVVYETQNRPSWAAIPTRALHRLVAPAPEGPAAGRVEA